jgi:hypothetical protein
VARLDSVALAAMRTRMRVLAWVLLLVLVRVLAWVLLLVLGFSLGASFTTVFRAKANTATTNRMLSMTLVMAST